MNNLRIPGVDGESTIKDELRDMKEGIKKASFAGGFAGDEERREEERAEREAADDTPLETGEQQRTSPSRGSTRIDDVADDELEAQEAEQGVGFGSSKP